MTPDRLPQDMKSTINAALCKIGVANATEDSIVDVRVSHLYLKTERTELQERVNNIASKLPEEYRLKFRGLVSSVLNKASHITLVSVKRPNDSIVAGFSVCKIPDQFNRRLGRTIALGRALKKV